LSYGSATFELKCCLTNCKKIGFESLNARIKKVSKNINYNLISTN